MKKYNKLVRDRIPETLDLKGIPYEKRIASTEEYRNELIKKLKEEVDEFMKEESMGELADVVEVVESLKILDEFKDVEKLRIQKKEERGGFDKRIILKGEKD
ncbi:MAG: hypothetical protein A2653_01220 [Candidatus Zambryskibacteria bacterium RIFCSPHIGHO2_01_FULL_43_25]|uniref:Phosphoribosyl-ATP pyrophosphohydrolase n=1 Tax=Candidatus Zambryskibacteria bacterium RIFCSPLOWO2_01_FULL_45_21 TaxID=1802761 RepID=A0A1G2U3Y0_9BACT|nr:MAG: hypothetical protein A2653_01220 [Candidatus Zambryskibacteria bacterium RIFCSPHIGHO2_01_FULL_43_25]OHB00423.1 MAG: hypothetical protein A3E94_01820 [Candidatus Zambryskibacteria bacterium RIFCSPHIGHO2_12_FULL_44_12b]OHB04218.1 MAG: hypothetical protein A3B14_02295 [Candidatus Zambryskibacteria bacterium RIFCSPLOWO2_01_FULL_45_21]